MDSLTPLLPTYSVLAIALAAGTNLSTTLVALPAFLHAPPQTLATQWKILYDTGKTPMIALSMSSAAGFAALAYSTSLTTRSLYIGAALAALGLAPWTRLVMWGNITELERRAKNAAEGREVGDTHELVKTWGKLNLWRGFILLSSAVLGMCASVR